MAALFGEHTEGTLIQKHSVFPLLCLACGGISKYPNNFIFNSIIPSLPLSPEHEYYWVALTPHSWLMARLKGIADLDRVAPIRLLMPPFGGESVSVSSDKLYK